MLQPVVLVLIAVLVCHASGSYLPPTVTDLVRQERIASFMAQTPLPTSALLAGAAMTSVPSSFPSPFPVGSHPLEAIPKGRMEVLEDEVDDLRGELEELQREMKRLKGNAVKAVRTKHEGHDSLRNAGQSVLSNREKTESHREGEENESR
ncbi:hypothetical protein MMC07_007374 [Pseudocyphellaria aurata]|nr:hypothetical protein [Pseudocyphellaria aurata]